MSYIKEVVVVIIQRSEGNIILSCFSFPHKLKDLKKKKKKSLRISNTELTKATATYITEKTHVSVILEKQL